MKQAIAIVKESSDVSINSIHFKHALPKCQQEFSTRITRLKSLDPKLEVYFSLLPDGLGNNLTGTPFTN